MTLPRPKTEGYFHNIDFEKSGKELLVELINYGNKETMMEPLKPEDVYFTRPVKLTNDDRCNTKIRFEKIIGYKDMEFPQDIEYNRMNIDQVAKYKVFDFYLEIDSQNKYKTSHDLLPLLWDKLKVKLLPEDVKLEDIDYTIYNEEKIPVFILKISDESIAYYGQLRMELRPRPIRIDTAIRKYRFEQSFQPLHGFTVGQ